MEEVGFKTFLVRDFGGVSVFLVLVVLFWLVSVLALFVSIRVSSWFQC